MFRFLALGDSYTIGESVSPHERWCHQLAVLLRAAGIEIGDPEIVATTGWTTDELSAGMDAAGLQGPYDLVSLLIGVNNQYRGLDETQYRSNLARRIERSIGLAGGRPHGVLVLSIPDWGVTPFASGRDRQVIGRQIDRFNGICREETKRFGAHFIHVTPISRAAAEDRQLLAADGLHPSGKMYSMWARLALPTARETLEAEES